MEHQNINAKLSIIIPTLNEASRLPLLISDLHQWPNIFEINVVDAGSNDQTRLVATLAGAKVTELKEASRGLQLKYGASISNGEWLLFIHADSRLNNKWEQKVLGIIKKESCKKYAWYFDFKLDANGIGMRLLEIAVAFRSYFFQEPYGDQGLLISKELYEQVGGYSPISIMEDLELIHRLRVKTSIKRIGIELTTSARKWTGFNIINIAIKNAIFRYRWSRGEDPRQLSKEYYS